MTSPNDPAAPLRSIDKGYVPVDTDVLFASLCKITALLDQLGVGYVLTGGTLLGAVREGDLIKGDTDWDLEITDDCLDDLLDAKALFADAGFQLTFPHVQDVFALANPKEIIKDCERRIIKVYDTDGGFHGDLFVFTLFADGMLRRVNRDQKAYFNAKMTYPVWFFENREKITIRDYPFDAPAEAEMMVERVYGPHWRTPLGRHEKKPGYNFAGAHANANVEKGIKHALAQGWVPFYPDAAPWPIDITHTNSVVSAKWIKRHEHIDLSRDLVSSDMRDSTTQMNSALVLAYRSKITSLRRTAEKNRVQAKILKQQLSKINSAVKTAKKTLE